MCKCSPPSLHVCTSQNNLIPERDSGVKKSDVTVGSEWLEQLSWKLLLVQRSSQPSGLRSLLSPVLNLSKYIRATAEEELLEFWDWEQKKIGTDLPHDYLFVENGNADCKYRILLRRGMEMSQADMSNLQNQTGFSTSRDFPSCCSF